jgi:hypothetical protein
MKLRVGDRVRFLNDVGGGKVTRIIDKSMVSVMNEDGFELPVLETELILINPNGDNSIIKKISDEVEKTGIDNSSTNLKDKFDKINVSQDVIIHDTAYDLQIEDCDFTKFENDISDPEGEFIGVFLAFLPVEQQKVIESDQELYIVNDSPYRAFYTISIWQTNFVKPLRAGFLHADTKELIILFKREELNKEIKFNIQILFFKNNDYVPQKPVFSDIIINPSKFHRQGSFSENDFFEDNALIIAIVNTKKEEMLKSLTDKAIAEAIAEKDIAKKVEPKIIEPELVEVDLHIQELVDNYAGMQPGEILEIQLARFSIALETGLKSKTTRKMVFIHGLGNGKLKNEVIKKLNKDYSKLRFQDASFKEYGFGATLVFLK